MIWRIDGYLAIPHELLHVLAYRIIGKKCHYEFGGHAVHTLESRTLRETLIVLLFPLIAIVGAGLFLMLLWFATYLFIRYPINPLSYFQVAPFWHKALLVLWIMLLLYAGSSFNDIRASIQLLSQKLRQKPPQHSYNNDNDGKGPQHPN
jgi:energy-coupling factor transporter transmembrane protein EcfT